MLGRILLGTAALACVGAVPVDAAPSDEVVVAVHASTGTCKCTDYCTVLSPVALGTACSDFRVEQPLLMPNLVFLVVARADSASGVGGVSCGVSFGDLFIRWQACAENEAPLDSWPASGGGNTITWDVASCQRTMIGDDGIHAAAGYFYVYAYGDDALQITPNAANGEGSVLVYDCNQVATPLATSPGSIGFGASSGFNPCAGAVDVKSTTWGKIKTSYERNRED